MELSKENLQELKQKRTILSDSDSKIICLLIEKIEHLEKENEQLKKKSKLIHRGYVPHQIDWDHFDNQELKNYAVVFYNRFACQTQIWKVKAKNEFRAGRSFYRKHNRKVYYDCIENIYEN